VFECFCAGARKGDSRPKIAAALRHSCRFVLIRGFLLNTFGLGIKSNFREKARLFLFLFLSLTTGAAEAAEVIPPKPTRYFNDYARVVSPAAADQLNRTLEDFEKQTSSQIVVAVFPKMQSDSSIEDYTVRVAQSWRVGQARTNNGAVLFVFVQDRQMFLQVGYGLEPVLTDALSKTIIENEIKPHFQRGNYEAGLTAGITAILQAARSEYKGTGRTVAQRRDSRGRGGGIPFIIFIIFLIIFLSATRRSRGTVYRRSGRTHWGGPWGGFGGGWGGGGRGGGGGFSGGGFSSGGGSFGGGGAGGKW
jgi:uncharacterized protein